MIVATKHRELMNLVVTRFRDEMMKVVGERSDSKIVDKKVKIEATGVLLSQDELQQELQQGVLEVQKNQHSRAKVEIMSQRPKSTPNIDWNFISQQEGDQQTIAYTLPDFPKSGVTVATGVDLGQMSTDQIADLNISDTLKQAISPYAGLQGQNAGDYLAENPLELSKEDATALDQAVQQPMIDTVANLYDAESTGPKFDDLPPEIQTVVADVAYQYGPELAARAPRFWDSVVHQRWDEAKYELRHFGDQFPDRRSDEANLLQNGLNTAAHIFLEARVGAELEVHTEDRFGKSLQGR